MPLRRRTAVRLLAGLLLAAALAGGLWWNSMRLNATERKLVGVWERTYPDASSGVIFLADGRKYQPQRVVGGWYLGTSSPGAGLSFGTSQWSASTKSIVTRRPILVPRATSPAVWRAYWALLISGKNRTEHEIVRLSDDELEISREVIWKAVLRRSTDPELLRLFEYLSAGNHPAMPQNSPPSGLL